MRNEANAKEQSQIVPKYPPRDLDSATVSSITVVGLGVIEVARGQDIREGTGVRGGGKGTPRGKVFAAILGRSVHDAIVVAGDTTAVSALVFVVGKELAQIAKRKRRTLHGP